MRLVHKFTEVELLLLIATITNYIDYLESGNTISKNRLNAEKLLDIAITVSDLRRLLAKIDC